MVKPTPLTNKVGKKVHPMHVYSAKRAECVEIMVNGLQQPDGRYKYLTTNEIVQHLGVSRATFFNWKNDDRFLEELSQLNTKRLKSSIANIDTVLVSKAMKGDLGAMKLYYQRMGLLTDKTIIGVQQIEPVKINIVGYSDVSSDENITDITIDKNEEE